MMDLIKEAGLNTLLGMGMTFLVLILLSVIIAVFGKLINGFQNRDKSAASSGAGKAAVPAKASAAAAEETVPERTVPGEMPAEDDALMAVIAAAVAAYESEGMSAEILAVIAAAVTAYEGTGKGYVVRKIRKSRRRVA